MSLKTDVLLDAALSYAAQGFFVLPLHYPIINKGKVFCSCHESADCVSIGKHPKWHKTLIQHGVHDATTDPVLIKAWWDEWPNANIGIATGAQSNLFVCDADSPIIVNDAKQRGLPPTRRVTTPRGEHAWFKHPGFIVPNKVKVEGFDFRGDGGLVVAPPSLHASGKYYEWLTDCEAPLAECPPWITQLITQSKTYVTGTAKVTIEDQPYGLGALKKAETRIRAAHNGLRNNVFYKAAASVYNLVAGGELTDATAEFGLRDAAEDVGLGSSEIVKTLAKAKQNGSANPRAAPKTPVFDIENGGKLTQLQIIEQELTTLGYTFRLNDCDDTLEVNGEHLTDALEAKIFMQMLNLGFKSANVLSAAMLASAFDHRYHPIKEYMLNLVWDEQDHILALAKCLPDIHDPITYSNGAKEAVCYVYLKRWLVGAIAKLFDGAQNCMLVFVGEQGKGKSSVAKHIGSCLPNRFVTDRINTDDKDHVLRLANQFIWDVDELDATTKKADVAAIKSFITKPLIDIRRAFYKRNTRKPACVSFIGTVNDNGAGFLMDETGSRRFMVVELSNIDFAYSQIDVHQLWAQAFSLYQSGEPNALLEIERDTRNTINADYEPRDLVEDYLHHYFNIDPTSKTYLTTSDILNHLTDNQVPIRGDERSMTMKIAKAAKRLKLEKYSTGVIRGYRGISRKPVELRMPYIKKGNV